jgi:HAD superfamily hydrolase (TIGR01509 family)
MLFEGAIFDMDGVLIDSEKIWESCELQYLRAFLPQEYDHDELQNNIVGRSIFGIFDLLKDLFPVHFSHVSRSEFLEGYEQFGLEQVYKKTNLLLHVREVLQFLSQKIPVALASSSPKTWISETLNRHDLGDFFVAVVSGSEVQNAKPHPEIFQTAAQKIGINPKKCFAVEDSKNGVLSAKQAGMFVFGFRNGFNEKQDLSLSDKIITDLLDLQYLIF